MEIFELSPMLIMKRLVFHVHKFPFLQLPYCFDESFTNYNVLVVLFFANLFRNLFVILNTTLLQMTLLERLQSLVDLRSVQKD